MELRGNLSKETRVASLGQFFDASFKRLGGQSGGRGRAISMKMGNPWGTALKMVDLSWTIPVKMDDL